MKEFWLLLKVLLKEKFRLDRSRKVSKSIIAAFIVLGIMALPMAGLIFWGMMLAGGAAAGIGVVTEGLTILITVVQLIVLIFGVVTVLNTVYFSKDTEIVLYLPIKPQYTFAAKVFTVYVIELIGSAAISLVTLLPYIIGAGLGFFSYLALIIIIFILPMLPLLLATILAIPLMFFVSFFKNKGFLSTIVYMTLFVVLFVGYYAVMMRLSSSGDPSTDINEIILQLITALQNFANAMFPNLWLASLATLTLGPALMYFAFSLGINIALIAIALVISSIVYSRSISKQLESPKSNSGTEQKYQSSGKIHALIMRDLKSIVRFPSLGFYCLMQVALMPVMMIVMSFSMSSVDGFDMSMIVNMEPSITAAILIGMLTFMAVGINYFASSSITRENDSFFLMKIMPVDYKTQIEAKAILAIISNEITLAISLAFIAIMFGYNILWSLFVFAICSVVGMAIAYAQVFLDLSKPNINWQNVSQGLKNNTSSIMGMLISLGIIAILAGIIVFFYWLIGKTLVADLIWLMWGVVAAVSIAALIVVRKLLFSNCNRLMENLFN